MSVRGKKVARGVPTQLRAHAAGRTKEVVKKVRAAMRSIEADVEGKDGIYPLNGGRLSKAELCRRAGISEITLMGKAHKASLNVEVDAWLKQIRTGMRQGKKSVRRAVTDRADQWKAHLDEIAQRYVEAKLELIECRAQLETLAKEKAALEAENASLREQVTAGKVVGIRSRRQ